MTQRISIIKGMTGPFDALNAMAGEVAKAAALVLPGHPTLPRKAA